MIWVAVVAAIYVSGFLVTWVCGYRWSENEMPSKDFGDFLASFIGALFAALVWPIILTAYIPWVFVRRSNQKTRGASNPGPRDEEPRA